MLCNVQSSHAQAALLEASTVYCTAIKDGPKTGDAPIPLLESDHLDTVGAD